MGKLNLTFNQLPQVVTMQTKEGNPLLKNQRFQTQKERVFRSFSQKPKTMLMVAIETGIERANICWIVLKLSKENRIQLTRKQRCAISKYQAGYYTTNPELFTMVEQLTLF